MANKTIFQISDFKHGDKIKGFYVCKNFQNKITRLGDEYLDLILEDSTGIIRGKIWSYVDEYRLKINKGNHVAVKGKIITYNNALEVDVLYINSIDNGLYDTYGFNENLILKYTSKKLDKIFNKLLSYCEIISTKDKKYILKMIHDYKDEISKVPSIDEHYNFSGGFLVQLVSVLDLNSKVCKLYSYDYTLSIVGIIFRHIGLLEYFDIKNNFLVSKKNKNLGYKLLGINLIDRYFKNENELVSFIKNIIISDEKSNSFSIDIINSMYDFDCRVNKL